MALPRSLADVDAGFMTLLLRARGVISPTNSVVALDERDVGMTAGYFSAIKRVICAFAEPTDAPSSYVVKTWPEFEILPKEAIRAMFMKDIQAYQFPAEQFFPRAPALLADFDAENDRWALVMQDVEAFAEHKTHENELNLDEVLRMIPGLVDMAVAWEGCHEGARPPTSMGSELASGHRKRTWASTAESCRVERSCSTRPRPWRTLL